ncbi:MAG: response regulator [Myxococcota bacterium]
MSADSPKAAPEAELTDALVPGLIHELRHPLTGMKAGLQLLARALGPTATRGEEWALVSAQLARLEELFDSYEEFLRPEQSAQGPFLLAGVVDHAVELLRHRTRPLGDAFSCQLPSSPVVTVNGTPRAVTHALTNLLLNALDAVEEAGGRKRVEVRLVLPKGTDTVELRVSDEGTGIKPEVAARLFTERLTTKAPGKGSGLGLSVARRMLAACGGSVALVPPADPQRAPWAATEFCITLRKATNGPLRSSPTPVPAPGPSSALADEPMDVLVVDDEPVITSLLQSVLGRLGHRVTTVNSSARALELMTAGKFDLLITDKNMPGLSGVDLAKAARERQPGLLVMLITAFASKESASELRKLGIDDYIKKPFELDDLVTRVRDLQVRSKALRAAAAAPAAVDASVRLAAVGVEPKMLERLSAAMARLEGVAVAAPDFAAALALVPPVDLVVVGAQHLTREAKLAVWKVRVERPGFGVVLLSDGGLEDELVGISVGTRFLLGTSLELAEVEAVLRAALGR